MTSRSGTVDELISGIRTECAIKLFGDDLDVLRDKAQELRPGTTNQRRQRYQGRTGRWTALPHYRHRSAKIARFGINVADVQEIITTAIGEGGDAGLWR